MFINFFKNLSTPTYWVDYSGHSDCIFSEDVENFDPEVQIAELVEENWIFSIKISQKEKTESEQEKFTRIFTYLANPENPLEVEKLEGVEFNDEQIGDLILHRVFGGNPHGESAMQAKILGMILEGKRNEKILAEAMEKKAKINEVRVFFGLSEL